MTNLEQWEKRLGLFFTPSFASLQKFRFQLKMWKKCGQAVKI